MDVRWRLRMAAAQREVWTGADLRRLLAERAGLEMSAASVSALLTKQPAQLKLQTLAALCTALGCTPNDLLEVDTTPVEAKARPVKAATGSRPRRPGGGRCRRYEDCRLRPLRWRGRPQGRGALPSLPGRGPGSTTTCELPGL